MGYVKAADTAEIIKRIISSGCDGDTGIIFQRICQVRNAEAFHFIGVDYSDGCGSMLEFGRDLASGGGRIAQPFCIYVEFRQYISFFCS